MYIYDDLVNGAATSPRIDRSGKFGSMFLSQVPTTVGLEVKAIADLDPDRAKQHARMSAGAMIPSRRQRFLIYPTMINAAGLTCWLNPPAIHAGTARKDGDREQNTYCDGQRRG